MNQKEEEKKKKTPLEIFTSPQFRARAHTHTRAHPLIQKMIQWLNVRAVGAIKASPFEERTPSPVSSYSSHSSSSSFTSRHQPERRPGWRADAQGLSLRLGPPCQPGGLFLPPPTLHAPATVGSEGSLSFFLSLRPASSSRGQPRPSGASFAPSRPLATIPPLSV